jgi:hypothetical protein
MTNILYIYNYKNERNTREGTPSNTRILFFFVNQGDTRSRLLQNLTISRVRQKNKINHKKNKKAHHQKTRTPRRYHHERKYT